LGWAAASGVGLILSAPVASVYLMVSELEIPQTAGILVWALASGVTFLAFLYGGYVSGGSADHSGFKHGLLVPALNSLAAASLVLFALVAGACVSLARALAAVVLPGVERDAGQVWAVSLSEIWWPCIAVPLLLSFLGGALGGAWGAPERRSGSFEAVRTR